MQGDLTDIVNGAPMPDMPGVIRKLAFAVLELQLESKKAKDEADEEARMFRGDASLAALLADHAVASFKKAGITTYKQASAMSDEELMALPGIGKKTVEELRKVEL